MSLTKLIDTELNREIGRIHWSDTEDVKYYPAFLYGMYFGLIHNPQKRYEVRTAAAPLMEEFERDFDKLDVHLLPELLSAYESLSWSGHETNKSVKKQAQEKYYIAWLCGDRKGISLSAIIQDMQEAKKDGTLAENKCRYLELELKDWEQQILEYERFVDPNSNPIEDIRRARILMLLSREMGPQSAKALQEKLIKSYLLTDFTSESPELLAKKLHFINAIPSTDGESRGYVLDWDTKDKHFQTISQCVLMHPKSNRFLKHLMRFNLTDTMDELGMQFKFGTI